MCRVDGGFFSDDWLGDVCGNRGFDEFCGLELRKLMELEEVSTWISEVDV